MSSTNTRLAFYGARAARFLHRLWIWGGSYLALDRPLGWRYTVPGMHAEHTHAPPAGDRWWRWRRRDQAPFYLGIALGVLTGHLLLGGRIDLADPHLGNNLAGLLLACALYPAFHRLAGFEVLRSGWGSLLLGGLFGFVFPVLELVTVG